MSLCPCAAGGQARDSGCPWSSAPLGDTAPQPGGFPRAVSEVQPGFAGGVVAGAVSRGAG